MEKKVHWNGDFDKRSCNIYLKNRLFPIYLINVSGMGISSFFLGEYTIYSFFRMFLCVKGYNTNELQNK